MGIEGFSVLRINTVNQSIAGIFHFSIQDFAYGIVVLRAEDDSRGNEIHIKISKDIPIEDQLTFNSTGTIFKLSVTLQFNFNKKNAEFIAIYGSGDQLNLISFSGSTPINSLDLPSALFQLKIVINPEFYDDLSKNLTDSVDTWLKNVIAGYHYANKSLEKMK